MKLEELTIGNGLDESVKVGPIINLAGLEKIKKYVQIGKEEGATLLAGGEEWDTNGELDGYFFMSAIQYFTRT